MSFSNSSWLVNAFFTPGISSFLRYFKSEKEQAKAECDVLSKFRIKFKVLVFEGS
jgi:hypothetical protein